MKKIFYKTILSSVIFLIWAFYPITGFIAPLISPWVKRRREFELKNLSDPKSSAHKIADICFEVSSEGELEQVMPLLEYFLLMGKLVELVYSSESVEKKVQALTAKFSKNLFIYRLPLVTFSPFLNLSWIKSEKLVLCRYDFYPHLILEGLGKKKFILLSASLKGKTNPPTFPYEFFDLIVCASEREKTAFEKLLGNRVPLMTLDLRILRILSRLEKAPDTLHKVSSYLEKIQEYPIKSRIILGSAYPQEMGIFENKKLVQDILDGKIHVCIAPHKLNQEFVDDILKSIPHHIPVTIVKDDKPLSTTGIALVLVPGILCELYSCFGHVFVGGGHIKSVHSLLEPYLAGAKIYCGPKINRSTEFDFIVGHSPENISVVTVIKDFYDYLQDGIKVKGGPEINTFKDGFSKLVLLLEEK
jgi:3-deoxy-D-manno-octulosonic-acid transferase